MIRAYIGKQGKGKTYAMTVDVIKELNRGRQVYTNYNLRWDGHKPFRLYNKEEYPKSNLKKFYDITQLYHLEDCLIALDEGYTELSSYRHYSKTSEEELMFIFMMRHKRIDFFYTVQRAGMISVNLRSQTDEFCKMDSIHIPFIGPFFTKETYNNIEKENVIDTIEVVDKKYYPLRKKYARSYDTFDKTIYENIMRKRQKEGLARKRTRPDAGVKRLDFTHTKRQKLQIQGVS